MRLGRLAQLSFMLAVGMAAVDPAIARDRRAARPAPVAVAGPLDTADEASAAKGCYWYRQKQYCGRHCYIEGNGIRYCREREPEAFPQMPEANVFIGEPYTAPGVK
jgi:hypothetical protein